MFQCWNNDHIYQLFYLLLFSFTFFVIHYNFLRSPDALPRTQLLTPIYLLGPRMRDSSAIETLITVVIFHESLQQYENVFTLPQLKMTLELRIQASPEKIIRRSLPADCPVSAASGGGS